MNTQQCLARRRGVGASVLVSMLVSSLRVGAQEAPAEPAPTQEASIDPAFQENLLAEVVVTGSNIRVGGFSEVVPVQIMGRPQLESFGAVQFNDVLKAIPGNSGSEQFTEASPRAGNAQFNLRGLGYTSTLTLVNGRRAGISPLSDDTGGEFVDINQFPLSMVERVEVLKDGASAIYGSDAVAGVVNIITRQGFDGLEMSGGYQSATNESSNLNLALGQRFDRGSMSVYATWFHQTGNLRSDFDWLVERVGGNGVAGRSQFLNVNGAPGTYRRGGRNASGEAIGVSNAVGFADPDCEAAGGVFRIRDDGTTDRSSCLLDFIDQVSIIPEATRAQAFAEFRYDISDRTRFFGEASFSRNTLESTRGPSSYANGTVVSNAAGNIFVPASHPFNFFTEDPLDAGRLVYVGPDAWDPAVHTAVDLVTSSRVFGTPYYGDAAEKRRSQTDYSRIVGGFELDLPRAWHATTSYQFAAADFTDVQPARYNANTLNAALLAGTLNPFGTAIARPDLVSPKDGVSVAANSDAILRQVLIDSMDTARTEQHVIDGVVTGKLFDTPAGPLAAAVGGQYREVTLVEVPDALQASGNGDNSNVAFPIEGKQDVMAAYAELSVPIARRADAQIAVRYEDYGGTVGSSVDPKFAARITPIDGLTLRGSISTSFQAPTIRQTSESLTRTFVNDPTSLDNGVLTCRDSGRTVNAVVRTVGDASLKPQNAVNYNFGIVMQPTRALSVSLDYWNYRYTDLIAAGANAQAILDNDCADGMPDDPRITRIAGVLSEIETSFINVGRVDTDGLDLAAAYSWDLAVLGEFAITGDVTYLRKFDVVGGEGGAFDGAGSRNFSNNFRTMPQWRGTGSLNWQFGDFGTNLSLRYIGSYKNDQGNNAPVDDWLTLDLAFGYGVHLWGDSPLLLSVGADNLFDRDPPALRRHDASGRLLTSSTFNYINRPAYDAYSGADLRGRVLWVRFKQFY